MNLLNHHPLLSFRFCVFWNSRAIPINATMAIMPDLRGTSITYPTRPITIPSAKNIRLNFKSMFHHFFLSSFFISLVSAIFSHLCSCNGKYIDILLFPLLIFTYNKVANLALFLFIYNLFCSEPGSPYKAWVVLILFYPIL